MKKLIEYKCPKCQAKMIELSKGRRCPACGYQEIQEKLL